MKDVNQSERNSIASQFASQTEMNSSILSQHKRFNCDQENDLQDFKQQIQYRYIRSVANKIYTYPLNQEAFDILNDEKQFAYLIGLSQYNLFQQASASKEGFKKQALKIKNKTNSSSTATLLQETLRSERSRILNMRSYINQAINLRKDQKQDDIFNRNAFELNSKNSDQNFINYKKKKLHTQPYEKPMGFVIKKR